MVIVASLEAIVLVAIVYLLLRERRADHAALAVERRSWGAERRELLNRVQRPERIPVDPIFDYPETEEVVDEIGLVGAIQDWDGEDGTEQFG